MDGENCKQSGCDGVIEGGFCNACGLEPANAAQAASPNSHVPAYTGTGSISLSGRTLGSKGSRRGSTGSHLTSSRKQLGLGMVVVPEIPVADPLLAVMKEAKVPDNKRFCSKCEAALNEREKGFCKKCGTKYSFVPTLKPGDVVAGQYEVAGCIAFGGLGWIYLAKDTTLSRWVVLKGLLNTADPSAAAVAVAERQFLAEVKHANIVGIYNFVQQGSEGYIVMEYVGGRTLKSLRKERGPLPVAEVLAYMHRVLGAFGYMHRQNLVYCDFKPDNVMLEGDDIKVIDLGGVRRLTDTTGDIYGTIGYSAPEVGKDGPSVSSDLYTIARAIAVLVTEFKGYQSKFQFSLPTPAEEPLFARNETLYKFLCKALHERADLRFQTADEMAEQLLGVMREVVSQEGNKAHPAESMHFTGDSLGMIDLEKRSVDKIDGDSLPSLKRSPNDPATQYILSNLSSDPKKQTAVFQAALDQYPDSAEALLGMAKNQIRLGNYSEAEKYLKLAEEKDPFDWRVIWYHGIALLDQGKLPEAEAAFESCYMELPGELAPKLAVALACERGNKLPRAIALYDAVSRTDSGYATAVFGLARSLALTGRRDEAVSALARVPQTSSLYAEAQKATARVLINVQPTPPGASELERASKAVEALALQGMERFRLVHEVLETALSLLDSRQLQPAPAVQVLGQALDEYSVRLGLEKALRDMARLVTDSEEKIKLVDQANKVRPKTLF